MIRTTVALGRASLSWSRAAQWQSAEPRSLGASRRRMGTWRRHAVALIASACWLWGPAAAPGAPTGTYRVVEICDGWAYDVNETGWVVGEAQTVGGGTRAFLWGGELTLLGTPWGGNSTAFRISGGHLNVAGWADFNDGQPHACHWVGTEDLWVLGLFGHASYAIGVDPSGTRVVGQVDHGYACRWIGGSFAVLPGLGYPSDNNMAHAVNLWGVSVGRTCKANGRLAACKWSSLGAVEDLSPFVDLGGDWSIATDINRSGTIVGYSQTWDWPHTHAFLLSSGPWLRPRDLGTLGGGDSSAWAVNDRGQVVGVARTASGDSHAFLYSGGAMLDLNDLVEPGTPWPIIHADGINNLGQIAATAYGGGTYRALRLDPINPTATEVEDASAAGGSAVDLEARLTDGATAAPITSAQLTFTVDGTAVGDATTDVDGIARLPVAAPNTQGAYDIEASFEGDAMHTFSMGSATLYVQCSPTSVYVTDRTGTISEQVVLRAYLRRTADGQWLDGKPVGFTIEGTPVGAGETGATGTSGRADLYWTISEGPAIRSIAAEFPGDASNLPSSGSATLTCLSWATKMATFNRTAPITDRTELKCRLLRSDNVPLYNKSVRFSVDGTFVIARPTNTQGYASYPYYTVPDGAGAGTRTILSEWPGKGGYLPVSKTATLTVLKAIPYIWVLPKTIPQGSIANLYAYFRRLYDYQKQIGKTVDFRIDGTVVQTVVTDANGVARYLYPTTEPVGVHTIRCEFYGDAWVDPGYGEGSLTIY